MIQEGDLQIPVVLNGYPLKIWSKEKNDWDDANNFMYRSEGKLQKLLIHEMGDTATVSYKSNEIVTGKGQSGSAI